MWHLTKDFNCNSVSKGYEKDISRVGRKSLFFESNFLHHDDRPHLFSLMRSKAAWNICSFWPSEGVISFQVLDFSNSVTLGGVPLKMLQIKQILLQYYIPLLNSCQLFEELHYRDSWQAAHGLDLGPQVIFTALCCFVNLSDCWIWNRSSGLTCPELSDPNDSDSPGSLRQRIVFPGIGVPLTVDPRNCACEEVSLQSVLCHEAAALLLEERNIPLDSSSLCEIPGCMELSPL